MPLDDTIARKSQQRPVGLRLRMQPRGKLS